MKKIILATFFLLTFSALFAQVAPKKLSPSDYSWRILQRAQFAYDKGDFATAMNLSNKAKSNRIAESDYELYVLDMALAPLAVRRAGDTFDAVLEVLKERDQNEAVSIIKRYIELHGEKFFKNSVETMKNWIKDKRVYPEADFLIGKIYRLEGEYKTAVDFYEKARLEKDFFDIPDQIFDVLYEMADLLHHQHKNEEYKQVLLLILDNDENYKDAVLRRAMLKIIDANNPQNVNRFFDLFRVSSPKTLNALYKISVIFEEDGETENSLFASALAAVESFSHILASVSERDANYDFSSLSAFLLKISEYEDICDWCEKNHFWDNLISYCRKVSERGNIVYANAMLEVISENSHDPYTRAAAKANIIRE